MKSIRTKFTMFTVCAVVIVVGIVTAIAVVSIRAVVTSNADQLLLLMCETGSKNLNSYFESVEQAVGTTSKLVEEDLQEQEKLDEKHLKDHMDRMGTVFEKVIYQTSGVLTYYYRIDPEISKKSKGFWYTNLDGEGFTEHEITDITLYDTDDTSELVWFTVPKATGKPVWLPPYITDNLDVRVISYNVPIYMDSKFIGVIGIEIDCSLMSAEVDNITLYENGYSFITDKDGNLIYHPQIDVAMMATGSGQEILEEMLTEERYFHYTFEGQKKKGVWLPLDNGMRLNVSVPTSEVNRIWEEIVLQVVIASILLLMIVIFVSMRYARRLAKPLQELTEATERVNQGDYNIELDYDKDDEAGILTRTFTNLVNNLQSELMALAESEQANKAKSFFLSNMSHEIRTPITTILGMNEIICRESEDKSILGYCENIRKAGNNLLGIISDILDFSKIEAGKMELIFAPYSLPELIGDLYTMLMLRAEEKGLILKLDIDPKLPEGLIGDELRIRQVITNLLTNAIKYTEEGSVTLKIALTESDGETATIHVAVADTGIGIREEEMDKLFSSFDRLDTRRTYTIEGTGLGLSICRRLLEMMGSRISVESTYNVGSTFSFNLKQDVSNPAEIGEFNEEIVSCSNPMHLERLSFVAPKSSILLVDDTAMNLEVIRGLLKPTQIRIDVAHSGAECIERFSEHSYDLVFLDYRMPQMNGVETLEALKEKEPVRASATPIISLTANAIQGERERMIEAGFTDYLTKPVNISEMDKLLVKYLPEDEVVFTEAEEDEVEDPLEGLPQEAFAYSWLNPEKGVEYCGSASLYLAAIELFVQTIDEKAELIEKCLSEDNIQLYTITVHALKSTSLSIGMESFSKRAKLLELAGKREDMGEIKRDTPDFLAFYRGMKKDLVLILEKAEETDG